MENNSKPNANNTNEAAASNIKAMDQSFRRLSSFQMILRLLVFLLTLTASILVALDKETKTIPINISQTLPPLEVHVSAKWQYMSAFVFFLVANTIACAYAAVSLIHFMFAGGKRSKATLAIILIDMIMAELLFSADGATAAVGVIGRHGNSHTHWNKVCDVFSAYCDRMIAALVLSLAAAIVLFWMVVLAVFNLYQQSNS